MIEFICKICEIKFYDFTKNRKTCGNSKCANKWKSIIKKGKCPKNIKLFIQKGKSSRFKKGLIPLNKKVIDKDTLVDLYVNKKLSMPSIQGLLKRPISSVHNYLNLYEIKTRAKGFQKNNRVQAGDKHWNWNGGVSTFINKIRASGKYKQWRTTVFKRDNYTCCRCGIRGGKLNAHHKRYFIKILWDFKIRTIKDAMSCIKLWDINNGSTLCKTHHTKSHFQEGELCSK